MTVSPIQQVLVTGATGFIGAHIVDELLRRGIRVRATARSLTKADDMLRARLQNAHLLEFAYVQDMAAPGGLDEAVQGVDAIIHVANKDMILAAIDGANVVLEAAKKEKSVKRIVYTSSFAAIHDPDRPIMESYTYASKDWTPLTYDEAKVGNAWMGYRAGKKFAELALWECIRKESPHFDLVVICPPYVFGPVVHPVHRISDLSTTAKDLWEIVHRTEFPDGLPIWVDVRDLAVAHAEALLRPEVSNQRFLVAAPEQFSPQLVKDIVREECEWAKKLPRTGNEDQPPHAYPRGDGVIAVKAFNLQYTPLRTTVVDSITQYKQIEDSSNKW